MNFDDIKSAWDNDQPLEDPSKLLLNLKLKEAKTPIDQLKKNMKRDLSYQTFAVIMIGFFPQLFHLKLSMYISYYALYFMMVFLTAYYFYKFFLFYRRLHQFSGNTKDTLLELYYELRLNIEAYKSLTFLLIPFSIAGAAIFKYDEWAKISGKGPIFGLVAVVIVVILFIIPMTNWWVNQLYGKYARRIRELLDELKEE